MKISHFFWTLPFICFITTYVILSIIFTAPPLDTPSLIGKQLPQVFTILSQHNLNPRILREQVDDDVAVGTIINQTPEPGQIIKPHQQIFLTISKHSEKKSAPQLVGMTQQKAEQLFANEQIKYKVYALTSKKPAGTVIAQMPTANTPLLDNSMIIYISHGNTKPVVCPHFIGRSVKEITQFLETYNIAPEIYHTHTINEHHSCAHCIVLNQHPLPGTVINLEKGLLVQLKVSESA